jgi:aspartyl/asparaginyl-tRNA synthetase
MLCSADFVTVRVQKYPLAKKKHSLEFMREIPHLRARTNTIGGSTFFFFFWATPLRRLWAHGWAPLTHAGVLRVRDTAASAIRDFFHENGFIELHTPILTSSDCEGTCDEQRSFFRAVTMTLTPTGQHTHTHTRHTRHTRHTHTRRWRAVHGLGADARLVQ